MEKSEGKPLRLISYAQLASKGIPYSRHHLQRLIKAGKFPAPRKMGMGTHPRNQRNYWTEQEIDDFITNLMKPSKKKVA